MKYMVQVDYSIWKFLESPVLTAPRQSQDVVRMNSRSRRNRLFTRRRSGENRKHGVRQ